MRQRPRLVAVPFALSLLAGCGGDSHEAIAGDAMALMDEMVGVLEKVKDKASAEAAKPELDALVEKIKALKTRMDALGKPDPATEKRLEAKMRAKSAELAPRLRDAMMQIADPEVAKVLAETMRSWQDLDPGK